MELKTKQIPKKILPCTSESIIAVSNRDAHRSLITRSIRLPREPIPTRKVVNHCKMHADWLSCYQYPRRTNNRRADFSLITFNLHNSYTYISKSTNFILNFVVSPRIFIKYICNIKTHELKSTRPNKETRLFH